MQVLAATCRARQIFERLKRPENAGRGSVARDALGLAAVVVPELRDCDYGAWRAFSFEESSTQDQRQCPRGCAILKLLRTAVSRRRS
jgi:hypothetical protein